MLIGELYRNSDIANRICRLWTTVYDARKTKRLLFYYPENDNEKQYDAAACICTINRQLNTQNASVYTAVCHYCVQTDRHRRIPI